MKVWPKKEKQPLCMVCEKGCEESDRNTDGTYAHKDCLYAHQMQPHPPAAVS